MHGKNMQSNRTSGIVAMKSVSELMKHPDHMDICLLM